MNIKEALEQAKLVQNPAPYLNVVVNWLSQVQEIFTKDLDNIKEDLVSELPGVPEDYKVFCKMILDLVEGSPSKEQLKALDELAEEAQILGLYDDELDNFEENE